MLNKCVRLQKKLEKLGMVVNEAGFPASLKSDLLAV
jgi:isopropylmalate/homocitrate/citramalate synthase